MPQVLNTEERSFTFWKFLLFFVITIIVIVTAIFFDFRMPLAENSKLKEESFLYRNTAANQERVANKTESIEAIMDSIAKGSGDADNLYNSYTREVGDLRDLNTQYEQGKYANGRINRVLIKTFTELKNKDKRINEITADLKKAQDKVKEQAEKIEELMSELNRPVSSSN